MSEGSESPATGVRAKPSLHYELLCTRCGARTPGRFEGVCTCREKGMLDAVYDLAGAEFVASANPFERFADLLPVANGARFFPKDARYSPCILSRKLGAQLGLPSLYLKYEGVMPTGSTKDRAAIICLAMMLESGYKRFATSSTGNAGTAYAYCVALDQFAELTMDLFVAEAMIPRLHYGDHPRINVWGLRDGSFVEAGALAAAYARQQGFLSDHGFFSPGKREGSKLAFFEATDQINKPIDWYVQAVSSGLGVVGTYKGAKELVELGQIPSAPRLLCVQESTCAPQVKAWTEGCEQIEQRHIVHRPTGIALATHRGDPSRAYPILRGNVLESGGTFTAVSEQEIREAHALVRDLEGLDICFNSATAVAGLITEVQNGRVSPDETILVNLTGRDRSDETRTKNIRWMNFANGYWTSEDGLVRISEAEALRREHDVRKSDAPTSRKVPFFPIRPRSR